MNDDEKSITKHTKNQWTCYDLEINGFFVLPTGSGQEKEDRKCRAKRSRENSVENFLIKSFKLGHGRLAKRAWRKNLLIQSKDPPQAQTPFREIYFCEFQQNWRFYGSDEFCVFFPSQEFPTSSKLFNSWKNTKTVVKLKVCASGSCCGGLKSMGWVIENQDVFINNHDPVRIAGEVRERRLR